MNYLHRQFPGFVLVALSVCILSGCSGPSATTDKRQFLPEEAGSARPYTSEDFDAAGDRFTFAVHSDLTGGERDGIFDIAIAQLSLLRPEFIINVGDLIEGGSEDPAEINAQWNSFDERAGRARAPLFRVGGNHDLTGEVMRNLWRERYGRTWYHFRYKDVLFLVLDTEDNTPERMQEIFEARNHALEVSRTQGWDAFSKTGYAAMAENAAGNITAEQSKYFVDVIAANTDVRWTFLFMHKAPWLREDLAAFTAIEDALADRPYTVFNGHQHAYAYLKRRGRDYIRLATTGGVQLTGKGRSVDQVTLVTVTDDGVDIANLLLQGILDKTGLIPLGGDALCFEAAKCTNAE